MRGVFDNLIKLSRNYILTGALVAGMAACVKTPTAPSNPDPSIKLTSKLISNDKIGVNVDMKNMRLVVLDMFRNDTSVSYMVRTTGSPVVYSNLLPGHYTIKAFGGGVSDSSKVYVQESPTTLSTSCRRIDLQQGVTTTKNLESCLFDRDIGDTSGVKNFRSLDNKTNVGFSGGIINLTPTPGSTGQYEALITVSNQRGEGPTTDTIFGNIKPSYSKFSEEINSNLSNKGESIFKCFFRYCPR